MRTAFACKNPPLRRIAIASICLALMSALSPAAEKGTMRLRRGAAKRTAAESEPSQYGNAATDGYGAVDSGTPMPELAITPPDASLWDGGRDYYASSGENEGTASFLDNAWDSGYQPSAAPVPYQEPVSYEASYTAQPAVFTAPPRQAPAVNEPPKRTGLRLRGKRQRAKNAPVQTAAAPFEPYSAPAYAEVQPFEPDLSSFDSFTAPAAADMAASSPSAEWDQPDPALFAGTRDESSAAAPRGDKYLDNTPAQKQDQEEERVNYGRDGTPSGHSDADAEAAGGVAKNLQPARIRSHPPAGKSEPFAFDAPAASDAVAPKTPFSAESSSRDAFQPSYAPRPAAAPPLPPTRMEVEDYRRRLELRLLERYNNLPDYAGKVGKVTVVLSKPLQLSLDGTMIRAEFDQLVFDPWGKRLPELEEEYYAVTFGSGGAQQVRADPSIRVGLDLEKTYSERAPLNADPFSRVPDDRAFRSAPAPESAPRAKMPEWWRPE